MMRLLLYLFLPLSWLYQLLFRLDRMLKKDRYRLENAIVISIGNLSVGGTGKTPFTIYLAQKIQHDYELPVTILSRGYGGQKSKQGMRVELDSDPGDCGDEPLLIKTHLPKAEVIIASNRFAAYQTFSTHKTQKHIVLLDDGFQHHAICRDFDFVLLDSQKRLGNGFTIPLGSLRETESALQRANCLIFTKYDKKYQTTIGPFANRLQQNHQHLNIFYSQNVYPKGLQNTHHESLSLSDLRGKKLFAFSGIGNPQPFKTLLQEQMPTKLDFIIKKDHHAFSKQEINDWQKQLDFYDYIICTEKDYIKIKNFSLSPQLFYLPQSITIHEEDKLTGILSALLST